MKIIDYDYLVLGDSISAYAAAIALASNRNKVALVGLLAEKPTRGFDVVYANPFIEMNVSGSEFYLKIREYLVYIGVSLQCVSPKKILQSEGELCVQFENDTLSTPKAIVYAPNGVTPGEPNYILNAQNLIGFCLSYCAWSDAFYYKEKSVCVIGCGYWAYDQVKICLKYTTAVDVLCPDSVFNWENKGNDLLRRAGVINIYDGVFWAPDPVCNTQLLGDLTQI